MPTEKQKGINEMDFTIVVSGTWDGKRVWYEAKGEVGAITDVLRQALEDAVVEFHGKIRKDALEPMTEYTFTDNSTFIP